MYIHICIYLYIGQACGIWDIGSLTRSESMPPELGTKSLNHRTTREVSRIYLLWSLLPVGGIGPVACEGFLLGGTCVCVLADGAGSSLEGNSVSSSEFWVSMGFPGDTSGKEPTCQCRRHKRCRCNPWVERIPWRREWKLTPVFLLGESHGQKSLVGYGP